MKKINYNFIRKSFADNYVINFLLKLDIEVRQSNLEVNFVYSWYDSIYIKGSSYCQCWAKTMHRANLEQHMLNDSATWAGKLKTYMDPCTGFTPLELPLPFTYVEPRWQCLHCYSYVYHLYINKRRVRVTMYVTSSLLNGSSDTKKRITPLDLLWLRDGS